MQMNMSKMMSLTLLSYDLTDSVKEASVARSEGTLVVDQLHLEEEGRTVGSNPWSF